MKTTYTEEELQTAIDAAFPEGARADDCNLDSNPGQIEWELEAPNRLAIAKAFLEKLEPSTPHKTKLTQNGPEICSRTDCLVGITHYEGSHPACTAKAADPYAELKKAHAEGKVIEVFVKDDEYGPDRWSKKENNSWTLPPECYRIKPEPKTPAWTPAVGDVVQLKSGGPKMTVTGIESTVWCAWFHDNKLQHLDTTPACLTLVTE